jgi:branched-chain amino acid transport system substrate-binding protein
MKTLTSLALACSLGLALAGCGQKDDTIKFGIGGPITGSDAAFGAQLKEGAQQAIADINEAGGILGKKISVSVGDDVGDPRQGVSVANNFVAEGVKYVIGHFNSSVTIIGDLSGERRPADHTGLDQSEDH